MQCRRIPIWHKAGSVKLDAQNSQDYGCFCPYSHRLSECQSNIIEKKFAKAYHTAMKHAFFSLISGVLAALLVAACLSACGIPADSPLPERAEEAPASAVRTAPPVSDISERTAAGAPVPDAAETALAEALHTLCRTGDPSVRVALSGAAADIEGRLDRQLEGLLRADLLCRTLMTRIDWSAEAVQSGAVVRLTPAWAGHVVRPVIEVCTAAGAVAGIADAWEKQNGRATVWASDMILDEDGWFNVLSTAELNSDALPYEAEELLLAELGSDTGSQVVNVQLSLPAGADDAPARQAELAEGLAGLVQAEPEQPGSEQSPGGVSAGAEPPGAGRQLTDEPGVRIRYGELADRCADRTDYDQVLAIQTRSGQVTPETALARTAYGALVDGRTICNGYARLYKGLCDAVNLPCRVVFGAKDGVPHSWNVVPAGGDVRFVDCTYMDMDSGGGYGWMTPADLEARGYCVDERCIWPIFESNEFE